MNARQYELLVHELVRALGLSVASLSGATVRGGARNRLQGRSGFSHQIDVTFQLAKSLVLIECKHWRRSVDARTVLELATRLADIRAANPSQVVHATLVSRKRATAGALTLAKEFGISIDSATSLHSYGLRLVDHVFVTQIEAIQLSDSCDGQVVRGGGA